MGMEGKLVDSSPSTTEENNFPSRLEVVGSLPVQSVSIQGHVLQGSQGGVARKEEDNMAELRS
eukprot:11090910-Prorocentrum_lima.AAC.1